MNYFDLNNVPAFVARIGEKYNDSSPGSQFYKDTRAKLQHLVDLLSADLGLTLVNNYNERPNKMAGQGKGFVLKEYILTGFVPKKFSHLNKKAFIKLSFYRNSSGGLDFGINIDVNYSDGGNKYNKDRDYLQSISRWVIPVDQNFPQDWPGLLKIISPIVKQRVVDFENHFGKSPSDSVNEPASFYTVPKLEPNASLNQILYGPPGTGKTFNSINKALEIIGEDLNGKSREDVKDLFDSKVKEGQIVFTTFHQNMSYEDFIEGIKPHTKNENVTYSIEDGIFKTLVKSALTEFLQTDSHDAEIDSFETLYNDFVNNIKPFAGLRQPTFTTKTGVEIMLVDANETAIQIKYVWSNNKQESEGQHIFSVTKEKLKKVLLEGVVPSAVRNLKTELHPLIGHIHCELFAVYKRFYEFIEDTGEVESVHFNYDEVSFKDVMDEFELLDKSVQEVKRYVIIIDEINRGNISKIFGELITLIEDSKRLGRAESLVATLPYSKHRFAVPNNVYIIGTMNTADRSVEALDTALRRRFDFEEMPPNPNLEIDGFRYDAFAGITPSQILTTINNRIEVLIDKDHLIGHSFFIKKDEETGADKVYDAFYRNIVPLLQEYFYGDYSKIGLVLGSGFVTVGKPMDKIFADPNLFEGQNFSDKTIYRINDFKNDKNEIDFGAFETAIRYMIGSPLNVPTPSNVVTNEAIDPIHQN